MRNNSYWPGEEYIDWIGVDAYNGGCNQSWYGSFADTVSSTVNWAKTHAPDKPIMLPEFGATEGAGPNDKANFFQGIPTALSQPANANIKAILYWNEAESGCDFRVNSSAASDDAYRTVGHDPVLSAQAGDPITLPPPPIGPIGTSFHPTDPTRLLDTRNGTGLAGPLGANQTVTLALPASDVPAGANAVALNVTVTQPQASGHLTAFPAGSALPVAANLNFTSGQTIPNLVIVKIGPGGSVSFNNSSNGTVQLVADLAGYFADQTGATFTSTDPTRLLDTRNGTGLSGPVAAHQTVTLTLPASDVPAGANAVALNVTVTQPQASGHLTAFPAGSSLPVAANLNFSAGQTIPNLVIVKIGPGGKVSFNNSSNGTVQLVADLAGYFADQTGATFTSTDPTRLLDTRNGTGLTGPAGAHQTVTLNLPTSDVPAGATAVALNVTVTQPQASGHLTAFPAGSALPVAANLNFTAGQTIPNLVIVKIGSGGSVSFNNSANGSVQLVADLAGYYTP